MLLGFSWGGTSGEMTEAATTQVHQMLVKVLVPEDLKVYVSAVSFDKPLEESRASPEASKSKAPFLTTSPRRQSGPKQTARYWCTSACITTLKLAQAQFRIIGSCVDIRLSLGLPCVLAVPSVFCLPLVNFISCSVSSKHTTLILLAFVAGAVC